MSDVGVHAAGARVVPRVRRRATERDAAPLVAVLCRPGRAWAAASAVALALAQACRSRTALAAAPSASPHGGLPAAPAARRALARLEAQGLAATASGRLVRAHALEAGEAEGAAPGHVVRADEAERRAAGLVAAVGRGAAAAAAPAALALPLARTVELDRLLGWHEAVVVIREPDVSGPLFERALAGLAALGLPVAPMTPPTRVGAALAVGGWSAPAEAVRAVDALGLGVGDSARGRHG